VIDHRGAVFVTPTRILITGFEPFDGAERNPSWDAASLVAAAAPDGLDITAVQLPCVFGAAIEELRAAVLRLEPDVVVCTGQAGGRPDVTVERVAVNVDDAPIPDNAGNQPVDRPIVEDGPAAYFATLPIKACAEAARRVGVPTSVSQTAGTYVCNHVFYGLMHLIATERPAIRGGFVHVPSLPEQVLDTPRPSMPAATIAEALLAIVGTAATTTSDTALVGGATH
jgi:pyroglutamyl-peptidase